MTEEYFRKVDSSKLKSKDEFDAKKGLEALASRISSRRLNLPKPLTAKQERQRKMLLQRIQKDIEQTKGYKAQQDIEEVQQLEKEFQSKPVNYDTELSKKLNQTYKLKSNLVDKLKSNRVDVSKAKTKNDLIALAVDYLNRKPEKLVDYLSKKQISNLPKKEDFPVQQAPAPAIAPAIAPALAPAQAPPPPPAQALAQREPDLEKYLKSIEKSNIDKIKAKFPLEQMVRARTAQRKKDKSLESTKGLQTYLKRTQEVRPSTVERDIPLRALEIEKARKAEITKSKALSNIIDELEKAEMEARHLINQPVEQVASFEPLEPVAPIEPVEPVAPVEPVGLVGAGLGDMIKDKFNQIKSDLISDPLGTLKSAYSQGKSAYEKGLDIYKQGKKFYDEKGKDYISKGKQKAISAYNKFLGKSTGSGLGDLLGKVALHVISNPKKSFDIAKTVASDAIKHGKTAYDLYQKHFKGNKAKKGSGLYKLSEPEKMHIIRHSVLLNEYSKKI